MLEAKDPVILRGKKIEENEKILRVWKTVDSISPFPSPPNPGIYFRIISGTLLFGKSIRLCATEWTRVNLLSDEELEWYPNDALPWFPPAPEVLLSRPPCTVVQGVYSTNGSSAWPHVQLGLVWIMPLEVDTASPTQMFTVALPLSRAAEGLMVFSGTW